MILCMKMLQNGYEELARVEKALKTEKIREEKRAESGKKATPFALGNYRQRIINAFFNMAMAVKEAQCLANPDPVLIAMNTILPMLRTQAENLKTLDDCLDFIQAVTTPMRQFHENGVYERYSTYSYDFDWRYAHSDECGEGYDLAKTMVNIFREATPHTRKINVLSLRSRYGDSMTEYKNGDANTLLYALNPEKSIDVTSKKQFERIALGGLKRTNISNDVFDVALLAADNTLELKLLGNVYVKAERDYLQKTTLLLQNGGILLFALPYFRFYSEICSHLAKAYEILGIYRSIDFRKSDYIYVIGRKKPVLERELDEEAYARLRNLVWNGETATKLEADDKIKKIELPKEFHKVDRFRGSVLDEDEILEYYEGSRSTAEFWEDQKAKDLKRDGKRPLLPFSVGHLGLVMTSGCLDGVVEENDGHKHAIKGRVIKRVDEMSDFDESENRIQVTETTLNRVEINAFLPDGTYKCLA